jgi:hypothetical protein
MKLINDFNSNGSSRSGYAYSIDYANREFSGHEFSADVSNMVFWAKHDLAPGDTARIYAYFRENGRTKGTCNFYYSGTTNNEWVKYNVPVSWTSTHTPDSVWVHFYGNVKSTNQGEGYILIDDFHFEHFGTRPNDNITNHDFEVWDNIGNQYPKGWMSIDYRYQKFYSSITSDKSVVKNLDAYSGDYSMSVSDYDRYGDKHGYIYPGTELNHYYKPVFGIDQRYNYLQGYYKYFPSSIDSGVLIARTFENGSQRSRDTAFFHAASEWTYFNLPINYYSENYNPDSATLMVYSSRADSFVGLETTLFLDALEFTMQPHTASIQFEENDTRIYPNPTQRSFIINMTSTAEVSIISPLGQLIQKQTLTVGENSIDIEHSSSGLYTLIFNQNNKQWQTKIVKL